MWDRRKIQSKWSYFRKQRQTPTGNFTEFVVRTYYAIYGCCQDGDGRSCAASAIRNKNISRFVYQGIYDKPDHDYDNVIEDCKRHLREMGYLHASEDGRTVFLDRPLDFLLEGEHGKYLAMLRDARKHLGEKKAPSVPLACPSCGKAMALRRGAYGLFFGCSAFPKCRKTVSVADGTYRLLQNQGIALYEVVRPCWKCGAPLRLKSYFPLLDFKLSIPETAAELEPLYVIRLSTQSALDGYLMGQYPDLRERYSKRAGFAYVANICPHCDALQGSLMTLSHVYDTLNEAAAAGTLQSHILRRIAVNETTLPREEWRDAVEQLLS